jgi:recombination protein RecR
MDSFSKLIYVLSKLPGIGEKSATRLAYYILMQDEHFATELSTAIIDAKQKIGQCRLCLNFSDEPVCRVCSDSSRDHDLICVVERPADVTAFEQSGSFNGVYHVLHGVLSPLDGIGPEKLRIRELFARAHKSIREIILAMNPSVEGDATALYLSRILKPMGIKVTRLAHGLPVGAMIEYTDRQTLGRALQYRTEVSS